MARKKVEDVIEITRQKTWETVQFKATRTHAQGSESITIDLEYNHATKKIRLYQPNQEMIRFDDDTIERAEMRAKLVSEAITHLKMIINTQ